MKLLDLTWITIFLYQIDEGERQSISEFDANTPVSCKLVKSAVADELGVSKGVGSDQIFLVLRAKFLLVVFCLVLDFDDEKFRPAINQHVWLGTATRYFAEAVANTD